MEAFPYLHIALQLAQNAAPLLLGVLGFCLLRDRFGQRIPAWMVPPFAGLLFGAIAVVSILASIDAGDGVRMDLRNAVVVTATLLAGISAGAITTLVVSLYRLWLGGGGAIAGVVGAGSAYGMMALYLVLS